MENLSPPEFFVHEKDGTDSLGSTEENKLVLIGSKKKMKEDFSKIKEHLNLKNDPELYANYLNSLRMKYKRDPGTAGSFAHSFAKVENTFVANCMGLKDDDINTLVLDFNRSFQKYLWSNGSDIDFTQEKHLDQVGIISAVKYFRSRIEIYKSNPLEKIFIFVRAKEDAGYGLDGYEVVVSRNEKGELKINRINFVQIKSKPPLPEDQEKILQGHRELNRLINTFEVKENNEALTKLTKEVLLKNAEEVKRVILEICKKEFDLDLFISKLNINDLSDGHKTNLLLKYIGRLKGMIPEVKKKYPQITDNYIKRTLEVMDELENRVKLLKSTQNKFKRPAVYSITAVGPNIVHTEKISEGEEKDMRVAA
jgi:hypothetical protein